MCNVKLDTKHPVHVFAASIPSGEPTTQTYGLTFTATEKCYLYGGIIAHASSGRSQVIKVNGVGIASCTGSNYSGGATHIEPFELEDGDVVTVSNDANELHIYKAKED